MDTVRHDAITLLDGARPEDFEHFVREELFPYFAMRYGVSRVSLAVLKAQSLLKDFGQERRYVWATTWDGSWETVRGRRFENALMAHFDETDAMLEKLDSFAERGQEHVMRRLLDDDETARD